METNGSTDVTEALGVVKDWASGKIKMRLAQRKILDCHAFAKEIENKEDTAIIYKHGIENCKDAVEQRKLEYIEKKVIYIHR